MELDTSLLSRVKDRIPDQGNSSQNQDIDMAEIDSDGTGNDTYSRPGDINQCADAESSGFSIQDTTRVDAERSSAGPMNDVCSSPTCENQMNQSADEVDNSIVLIPDTPSPVFSRFVGKKFSSHQNSQGNQSMAQKSTKLKYPEEYGYIQPAVSVPEGQTLTYREDNKTFSHFQDVSDGIDKNYLQSHKNRYFDKPFSSYNKDISGIDSKFCTENDGCTYNCDNKVENSCSGTVLPETKKNEKETFKEEKIPGINFVDRVNEHDVMSRPDPCRNKISEADHSRITALKKIKAYRERKKEDSKKRYFSDVWSSNGKSNNPFKDINENSEEFSDDERRLNFDKYAKSHIRTNSDNCSSLGRTSCPAATIVDVELEANSNSQRTNSKILGAEGVQADKTLVNTCPDVRQGRSESESDIRHNALERLKKTREKKRAKLQDGCISSCNVRLKNDSKTQSRKFSNLYWPSESESETESDCSDSIPLREILSSNKPEKKNAKLENTSQESEKPKLDTESSLKKQVGDKKHSSSLKNSLNSVESLSDSKDTGIQKIKCDMEKPEQSKSDKPRKVQRSTSVISISSDDSLEQYHENHISDLQLERMMSDDYIPSPPVSINNSTFTVNRTTSPRSHCNYLNFRAVRPNIDAADSVSRDLHVPDNSFHGNNITSNDLTDDLLLQSPRVTSSSNLMRGRTRVPGLKRPRSSISSVKGRAIRSRSGRHTGSDQVVSPDRCSLPTGAVGFSPASSMLRRRSRGDCDPVRVVEQLEHDEEYARKLQEQMDLEFAMSLHNMENTPPPQTQPHGHWSDNHDNLVTSHYHHNLQGRHPSVQGHRGWHNARRSDLEALAELEDLLDSTDESLTFGQMMPVSSPPRLRSRAQRRSRSQRANTQNYLNAIANMEVHLTSLLDDGTTIPMPRGRQRGRRGNYFTNVSLFNQEGGNDYEDLLNLAEMLGEVKEKGLSQAQASRLPERKFQGQNNPNDLEECMICMCEYVTGDSLRILPCFHEFHKPCIDKWIQGNATCPICRVQVKI